MIVELELILGMCSVGAESVSWLLFRLIALLNINICA